MSDHDDVDQANGRSLFQFSMGRLLLLVTVLAIVFAEITWLSPIVVICIWCVIGITCLLTVIYTVSFWVR